MEGRALREDDGGRSGVRSAVQGRYRGLVVDFGGVLSTSFDGAQRSFCVREGLAPDALSRVFSLDAGAKGLLVDLERGAIGQDQFVAHLAPALGVCPDGLLERIVADLRPEPLVTAAVQELRRRGIPVVVLTNSWGTEPFDPYQPFDLQERFDAVVISHQVGLRKPDPQIFALAADRIAVPPSECVFVDDVERYLPPARALGMAVIHATDPTTTVTELNRHFRHP
jgi:putative hydrolase of the HAD superfamily